MRPGGQHLALRGCLSLLAYIRRYAHVPRLVIPKELGDRFKKKTYKIKEKKQYGCSRENSRFSEDQFKCLELAIMTL